MTGLPMVFAVWAGSKAVWSRDREQAFVDSCRYGMAHMDEIARIEHAARGVTLELARDYLTHNIAFDLGEKDYDGLGLFLRYAAEFDHTPVG
jgi:chorismate dehydratase